MMMAASAWINSLRLNPEPAPHAPGRYAAELRNPEGELLAEYAGLSWDEAMTVLVERGAQLDPWDPPSDLRPSRNP